MGKPKKLPTNYSPNDSIFVKGVYPWAYIDYSQRVRTIPDNPQWAQIAMNPYFLKSNIDSFTTPDSEFKAAGTLRDQLYNTPNNEPYVRYIDSLMYNKDTTGVNNLINSFGQSPTSIPSKFMSNYTKQFAGGGLSRFKDYGSSKKPYPMVKSKDFAGPNRSYPIPTKADAIDALRLAGLHNRPDVKAKVYAKYPELKNHADGGLIDEYGLGGWIKDNWRGILGGLETAAGVAALATGIGAPLGAGLITGGVGMMGREIASDQAYKQQSELMKQQQDLVSQQQERTAPTSYTNAFAPTFGVGGLIPGMIPNAELEKKEVGQTPDGTTFQVNAPTHKQGGIDLSLPPGTMIFSDRDKAANGQTYAKNAAKYKRIKDAAVKRLRGKVLNKVTKDSLDLSVKYADNELNKLFIEQEMNKPKNKRGKKFGGGGRTDMAEVPSYLGTSGFDPYQLATSTINNNLFQVPATVSPDIIGSQPGIFNTRDSVQTLFNPSLAQSSVSNKLPLVQSTTPATGSERFNNFLRNTDWGYQIASLAPVAFNTAMAFRKPDLLNPAKYRNDNAGAIKDILGGGYYNIDPMLQANRAAQNSLIRNLTNMAGSPGQLASNLIGGATGRMRADAAAYAQKNNEENRLKDQYARMLYMLGRDNSMTNLQADMYNLGALNNRFNYAGTATSQLSQYAQMQKLMGNQSGRDKEFLQMMPDIFGNMMKFLPYLNNLNVSK